MMSSRNNPWSHLKRPVKDLSIRLVDPDHTLDLFWATDNAGDYLFVWRYKGLTNKSPKGALPSLSGMMLNHVQDTDNAGRYVLRLIGKEDWEIFMTLCSDLVEAMRRAESEIGALEIFLRRMDRWQNFLRRKRPTILNESIVKGLIGELHFLFYRLNPEIGLDAAVNAWGGPFGTPQDFCHGENAFEVKCQSGGSSPSVRITSAEQLTPQVENLYLYVLTMSQCSEDEDKALTLPGLIDKIRNKLIHQSSEALEKFSDALIEIGYIDSPEYDRFCYILVSESTYRVTDGFPRITTDIISPALSRVSYSIPLSACSEFEENSQLNELL
jgi:hypothetical protein